MTTINDRHPNFRDDDGTLYLVRCFACDERHGRENAAINVARGVCTWCGWTAPPTDAQLEAAGQQVLL